MLIQFSRINSNINNAAPVGFIQIIHETVSPTEQRPKMNPPPFSPRLLVDTSRASPAPAPAPRSGSRPTSLKTNTPRTLCTSPSAGPAAHTEPTLQDAKPVALAAPGPRPPRCPGLSPTLASHPPSPSPRQQVCAWVQFLSLGPPAALAGSRPLL